MFILLGESYDARRSLRPMTDPCGTPTVHVKKILNIQFEQIVYEMTGRMRTILVQTTL